MSTETPVLHQTPEPRITATINTIVELDPSFGSSGEQVVLPAHLGTPGVSWGFDDNQIETLVSLKINGEDRTVVFWDTDEDGTLNTAENKPTDDKKRPWDDLGRDDFYAAIKWGGSVHARILRGANQVTQAVAARGSEAYNAVIEFATGSSVEAPVLEVHELGEDGDRWLVTGTTEDTHPSRVKTEVGKYLVDALGVGYDGLPTLIEDLKDAKLTFRDNWVLEPVDPARPDEDSLLKRDDEADHQLPRFAATLVTI